MSKHSKRILFLDDEPEILALYSSLFKSYKDLEIVTELKTIDALSKAAVWDKFDLIVTDICMPDMDGVEFVDRLNQLGSKIPIIVISGYGTAQDISEIVRCKHIIPKPFSCESVEDAILKVLCE